MNLAHYTPSISMEEKQAEEIVQMQCEANHAMAGNNWKKETDKYLFYRAGFIEAVEAIDEFKYKWWKSEEPDFSSALAELIDVLHFAVSSQIIEFGEETAIKMLVNLDKNKADLMPVGVHNPKEYRHFGEIDFDKLCSVFTPIDLCEQFIVSSITKGRCDLLLLFTIFDRIGITGNEVHGQYVGKNALNMFRNDYGQKTGKYVKDWGAGHDTYFLQKYIDICIDQGVSVVFKDTYDYLELSYNTRVLGKGSEYLTT